MSSETDKVNIDAIQFLEEVKKRPCLYQYDHPIDREEKMDLWKEVGAAMFKDWSTITKATQYDRVLQLQKKWRCLRDSYNRELRSQKLGLKKKGARVYMYFRRMSSFMKGFEYTAEGEQREDRTSFQDEEEDAVQHQEQPPSAPSSEDEKFYKKVRQKKKKSKRRRQDAEPEQIEVPLFESADDEELDTDKLFLMSFLPELRQLPVHLKMWARAQIANVMQEAVSSNMTNSTLQPEKIDMKRSRSDSYDDENRII